MKRFMLAMLAAGLLTVSLGATEAQAQRIRVGPSGISYRNGGGNRNYNYNRGYRNYGNYGNYNSRYYGNNYYGNSRYYGGYKGGYYGSGYGYAVPPGYYSNNFSINPYGVYYRF